MMDRFKKKQAKEGKYSWVQVAWERNKHYIYLTVRRKENGGK